MLAVGAVVTSVQVPDPVSKGGVDRGHTLPVFGFGRNTVFGLFGAVLNFGMNCKLATTMLYPARLQKR